MRSHFDIYPVESRSQIVWYRPPPVLKIPEQLCGTATSLWCLCKPPKGWDPIWTHWPLFRTKVGKKQTPCLLKWCNRGILAPSTRCPCSNETLERRGRHLGWHLRYPQFSSPVPDSNFLQIWMLGGPGARKGPDLAHVVVSLEPIWEI